MSVPAKDSKQVQRVGPKGVLGELRPNIRMDKVPAASKGGKAGLLTAQEVPIEILDLSVKPGIKYVRGRFLGKGGFAKCYEVLPENSDESMACKIVHKNMLVKEHHREKMAQEIMIHRTLKHPNVVGFHSYFDDDFFVYIVLELCEKKSLMELSKRRRTISEPEARYFLRQICEAVRYLHEDKKIIHRDLKLGNIFISSSMDLKLGDFGLATTLDAEGLRKRTMCGTPNYIDNCVLPESWKGRWFQSGVSQILIDSKSMGEKGTCYERSGDKFLFVASEKNQDCFRCIVINGRHKNVLQYKESSYCEDKNSLENLCSQIPGDAQLYSLFRIDAQPEDCPFKGAPFTFTYNRGHGECKNPVSSVDTCTEPSRLLLRYQACPDVQKTESTAEELQCLAQWKEGSHHYLVGKLTRERSIASNEESYRCFIFEKTKTGHGGYTVAMSGDATCTGIASSTEGARTLTFTKVDKGEGKCAFPAWVASHHWHTLDGKMSAKMHHKNSTMHITEDNRRNSSGHYSLSSLGGAGISGLPLGASGSAGILGGIGAVGVVAGTNAGTSGGLFSTSSSSLFTGGTRIVCQSRVDIVEGRHVAIVAKHTQGCKSEEVCMHIYQRAKHVTEIQMLRKSDQMSEDFECGKASALGPTLPYVTLVNPEAKSNRCPNLGRYMATGVSTDGRVVRDACGPMGQGGFHTLIVGCGDRATMEFHSKCATHNPISSYECHGSWEENGTGFLIASSLSRSSTSARRYCFNYQETDEGLRVFSSSESCRRNVSPGIEGVWAFNLTIDGQCAQAVTGSGSSRFQACDLLIAASMISFLTFTSVFQLMLVLQSSPFIRSLRPARTPTGGGGEGALAASHVANLATTTAATTSATFITGMTSRISSLVSR